MSRLVRPRPAASANTVSRTGCPASPSTSTPALLVVPAIDADAEHRSLPGCDRTFDLDHEILPGSEEIA
ncbi:hypothetical protein SK854_05650 [Lentzea sp. BCCO 10_0061]|uniref:Uncharacterized protein n=1 Tax=Lentzea sokolovensis TaxID=3095429 RepID=A0ABU4UQZ4_9PSEU|nr:hypothetical protein [Lentzea sp. BCCO 10_0061]MDX8141587.1 hypothetical protein [Lentzea sp. BCCO 10_0061]